MGSGLKDIMLEIVLVEDDDAVGRRCLGKALDAINIPLVEPTEVILAQSVPRMALSAARYRLLIEWCPHVAIAPTDALMVVAATVIP